MSTPRGTGRSLVFSILLVALSALTLGQTPTSLGGLTELYPWPEETRNRVANSSFENRDRSDAPAEWHLGVPNHWGLDSSTRHSGKTSLRLTDSHLAPFTPLAEQELSLEPGWYTLRGFMKAERAGNGGGGRITLARGSNRASTRVISGDTAWIEVARSDIRVSSGQPAIVRMEAYSKPDGRIFFDDISVHRLVSPLVEGFLLYPNYRGVLFEDASQTILVSVTSHSEADDPPLKARVSLEAEGGGVIASVEEPIAPGAEKFVSLDASKAPTGRFRLRIEALDSGNQATLFQYPVYTIVKMSASEKATLNSYVDEDNVLVIRGGRRFPLGIYDTSSASAFAPRISKIAEGPFTLYLNYWLGGASRSEIEALTAALGGVGMSYIHTANAWYESNPNFPDQTLCGASSAASLGEDGFTACKARELSDLPGLLGWYTADERPAGAVPQVFEQYRLLRDNDRDGVTFIAQNLPGELSRWRDAADVIGVDPYPIYNIPEGALSPFEMVTNWVRSADRAVHGSRPVWAVIQFFQHGSRGHWPTRDELRTMSYMAIIAGARGLFYWSFGANALDSVKDPAKKDTYWKRLVEVTEEIAGLESVLIAPDASVLQSISEPESILWLGKELNGSRYVFAVNNTSAHVEATLTLSSSASRAEVPAENRSISVSGRSFRDSFRPYEAHVYRLR